jgi:hypothetical protein
MYLHFFLHVPVLLSICTCTSFCMFLFFCPNVPAFLSACSCSSVPMYLRFSPHVLYLRFSLHVPALLFAHSCASVRMYLRFSSHVPLLLSPCSFFDTAVSISVFYKLKFSFIKPTYLYSMHITVQSVVYAFCFAGTPPSSGSLYTHIYNSIKHNTIQYNTIQYNKIQYNTIQ